MTTTSVKFVDSLNNIIGGYGVVWGDPANKDLVGDYFTPQSDLALDWYPERPLLYQHGLDNRLQTETIGKVIKMTPDEVGVWVEAQLDLRKKWSSVVKRLVANGVLNYSSGSVERWAKKSNDGKIERWPIVEMTLTPMPAEPRLTDVAFVKAAFKSIGLHFELPRDLPGEEGQGEENNDPKTLGGNMPESFSPEQLDTIGQVAAKAVVATLDARDEAAKAAADQEAAIEAEVQKRLEAHKKKEDEGTPPAKSLPGDEDEAGKTRITSVKNRRYDHLTAADLSTLAMVLNSAYDRGHAKAPLSDVGFKALMEKTALAADGKPHALPYENRENYQLAAIKAIGELQGDGLPIKSDELNYSTQSSYGDEWVAVAYGSNLWESIRIGTFLLPKMPSIEVPAGHESIIIPLEGADPTWYVVAQTTDLNATTGAPDATITASKMGTGQVQLTLAKMGARTVWSGEMSEDSLIPWVPQLRSQFEVSGQEILEAVIINGDTESSANKNINDIAGTPAASDYFMAFNGFRKSPLITTTANSRDGGVLAANDYLETVKLMGNAGKNALNRSKVEFIIDPLTHYKSLELPEVKTKDVRSQATIEGGQLTGLWGYKINVSGQIAYRAGNCLSNSAGKVDVDTTTNNAYGQILAVRYDQWRFAFRRRMTMETTRYARADPTELVAMVRIGLIQRDTEAAAISYNLTV